MTSLAPSPTLTTFSPSRTPPLPALISLLCPLPNGFQTCFRQTIHNPNCDLPVLSLITAASFLPSSFTDVVVFGLKGFDFLSLVTVDGIAGLVPATLAMAHIPS
ncbi:hypothetical protein K435DRAFT_877850 [Dendrothele bispora CBS 962.96]|uniref:Uncharacterized protein n=1 Tax=Dendrothele bispora (strain CBS 962.96) TaxID=1314807 RepID=A0A4S8KP46_DENBC|nr:hypothetical protein K435DRAFT_877850 [Dendrothele bispora CBS 962.96]